MSALDLTPYDAVLVLSFGGPEGPDEVLPFLRRVTAGRGIPDERLAEVGEHYIARGGVSPINRETREFSAALAAVLRERGCTLPVLWGNRNAAPFLTHTLREAAAAGARRVVTVLTSAYAGYSSCRQYREDLATALSELADEGISMTADKIRPYSATRGFTAANARLLAEAVRTMTTGDAPGVPAPEIAFVTHSVPRSAADRSGPPHAHGPGGGTYVAEHQTLAEALLPRAAEAAGRPVTGRLVYCSRSGAPGQPWLEPDVNDYLRERAAAGVRRVVIAPIGFVSDHMEVVHDLDTEAAATAAGLGIELVRVPTVRCAPEHVAGIADLLDERAREARGEDVSGRRNALGGTLPSRCAPGCCPGRVPRPAAAGQEGSA